MYGEETERLLKTRAMLAEPVMVWDQGFKEAEVSYPENPTLNLYRALVISPNNAAVYWVSDTTEISPPSPCAPLFD